MKKLIILMISLAVLVPLAFTYDSNDMTDQNSFKPKYYDDAKVLRVKFTEGEAYIRRSYDEGLEEAAINLPIFEKDIAGTTDGRLEVYLGKLNYIRLDYDTELTFDRVPELRKTEMSLRLNRGGIFLDIENLDYERDIEIQTPDCGVFLLDKGLYRINVSEGGRTEIYVHDGVAEVSGDRYSRNVRANQKIVMFDGMVKERPYYFYSSDSDGFDDWNRDRNSIVGYARYSSSSYLDNGYEEYEYELSRNGRWRYDSELSCNVWVPYSIGVDWRPYYNGRWVYNPFYGYVWMSYDSWGFFTHHYGRWHWSPQYRWYWVPGYRWSPAWVSWFWDNDYYGWCPLSWWNRPVIVYNGRWWRNHHYWRHGIPRHARSTIIIRKNQLSASRINKVALSKSSILKSSNKSFVFKGHSPKVKPVFSKVKVINANGKSVVYKKNGIRSPSKYKLMRPSDSTGLKKSTSDTVYKYSGKRVSRTKESKYKKSSFSRKADLKTKSYKYKSSAPTKSPTSRSYGSYGTKSKTKSVKKTKKYSSSSKSKSSSRTKYRSSSSSKGSKSSGSSSSGSKKIKKKKGEPSYSYKSYGSKSKSYKSSSSGKSSYSSSYKKPSRSSSSSYSSSYKKPSSSSSYSSSYKKPSRSSSSYSSNYRKSSSSSSSSYKPKSSSSYKSSGKSYSKPSSSYKSKRSSSYSKSSSSGRSSSYKKSSSSSSSRSYKKKK